MFDFSERLTVFAPAKVNLHLAVKERRQDGFHNLESLFLLINFGDYLHFSVNNDGIIDVVMDSKLGIRNEELGIKEEQTSNSLSSNFFTSHSPLPVHKNIIYKAVSLFKELTGFNKGLKIEVDKRIPVGGGLGGGSSDAASTLLALNKIAGYPLSLRQLLEAAASLGSDVPFFIHETPAAWVTGRGEIIEPLDAPKMFLVLVNPGFQSETAAAFKLLDDYRKSGIRNEESGINTGSIKNSSFLIPNSSFSPNSSFFPSSFSNDFLPVFKEQEKSAYLKIISRLRNEGAFYANLSGAGSTCFGVFDDEDRAQKTAEVLRGKWDFAVYCCSGKQ